jgi:hypothetical protein
VLEFVGDDDLGHPSIAPDRYRVNTIIAGFFAGAREYLALVCHRRSGSVTSRASGSCNGPGREVPGRPEAVDHLAGLTARQSATVLDVVVRQLSHEPATPTRNRKVLRANSVAPWELRIGLLRVYDDFVDEPERVVVVKAVGIKDRNRVRIGEEEVEL